MAHDVIFLENRRTPKIVKKGEKYTPTEAEGKIKSRRAATEDEEKTIARGDWVRVNEHGDKPSDPGYKRKKSKVRPGKHTNAGQMAFSGDYEGVTHAGVALVAADTGRVFLSQRTMDATDDPAVQETWEFPGGGVNDNEDPLEAMIREWGEEIGEVFPEDAQVVDGWRAGPESDTGNYQGFVAVVPEEFSLEGWTPTSEVQAVTWVSPEDMDAIDGHLRPEVRDATPWDKVWGAVSGNQEDEMDETEPEFDAAAFEFDAPIPVHGVIAPEEMPSGDKRAFGAGSMTKRPLRLPFSDQKVAIGGHDGSVVVGSVDRMMRKGGMIHWEGAIMPGEDSESLVQRMEFFDGKYGVSVDGDQGSMDADRTEETGTLWFDQIRAAGLTAVAIPAFHEAYVAFGNHPEMPGEEALTAAAYDAGDLIGDRRETFKRGPGWATNPKETNRLHRYWTEKGQPGYAKVAWGTLGDFTRAKKLIGAKIAEHSPDKMKYLNQIIAQWHFDALGYWPGDKGKPGNAPDTKLAAQSFDTEGLSDMVESLDRDDIEVSDDAESVWETVLVSSVAGVSGNRKRPPLDYFHQHPKMVEDVWALESGALIIEEPDAFGFQRAWGFAAERGVCHVGMDGRCVEPPMTGSDDYPEFHLGVTRTEAGIIHTGVLTYGVGHRDAQTMLSESPNQAYFDNIKNAWAAVRVGENERGIWFSGVVLPKVDADDITLIEASGQVSGEWLAGAMRACLTVNVPGFPNERPSAVYDEAGNVMALAASAFGQVEDAPCAKTDTDDPIGDLAAAVMERIDARAKMVELSKERFAALKNTYENGVK